MNRRKRATIFSVIVVGVFLFSFFVPLFYVKGVFCSCPIAYAYCDCGTDHYVSFTLLLTKHGYNWYGAAYFPNGNGIYWIIVDSYEWEINLNRI